MSASWMDMSTDSRSSYLSKFTAEYIQELCVNNHLDIKELKNKTERISALIELPELDDGKVKTESSASSDIALLLKEIQGMNNSNMEKLLTKVMDNKSAYKDNNESLCKIKGLHKMTPEDDMYCYLSTFERMATLHKRDKSQWTAILEPLLIGRAQKTFHLLCEEDKLNYDIVSETLMRAYSQTSEAYRIKFLNEYKKPSETFEEYGSKLELYFRR